MGTSLSAAHTRTVFAGVRRVRENRLSYDLVLPAARLFGAAPLVEHDEQAADGCPTDAFPVAVTSCLIFDQLDERRGFGLVTLPLGIRMGFAGVPEIRHGMVRVTLVAPLPQTVWRLDAPLEAAVA